MSKTRSLYRFLLCALLGLLVGGPLWARDYYVNPQTGSDLNTGSSPDQAFRSLDRLKHMQLKAGDQILLACGTRLKGSLQLIGQSGTWEHPIVIRSYSWPGQSNPEPAEIDFKGYTEGLLLEDANFIEVDSLLLTGNGYDSLQEAGTMRCGVIIRNQSLDHMQHIVLNGLHVRQVFYENPGFTRPAAEVKSPNGTQHYGYGIRAFDLDPARLLTDIVIRHCRVENVSHTGIQCLGSLHNIREIRIDSNQVAYTGGPGMQMSGVELEEISGNQVDHSGSHNDSRKWGRGSGLWTWGCSQVMIRHNRFSNANGPGDSDGTHIDFNCDNIVIEYNLSLHNAGGFCEILGNDYNCSYRYNISVNDGYRKKGVDGAFQDGKTLWLSSYVGTKKPRRAPRDIYIYNNTILADSSITPRIAIDDRTDGLLIANNIFQLARPLEWTADDQAQARLSLKQRARHILVVHNLFSRKGLWPESLPYPSTDAVYRATEIPVEASTHIETYELKGYQPKGLRLERLPDDLFGLLGGLNLSTDMLGRSIPTQPGFGALIPQS